METLTFDRKVNYASSRSGIEIEVNLIVPERRPVRLIARVDTGATYCIFQRDYAEQLGIDVETGQRLELTTATGSFVAYGHCLTLACLNWHIDTMVYFAMDAGFARNVVGQIGWLEHFKVGIIHHESMLLLSHYGD